MGTRSFGGILGGFFSGLGKLAADFIMGLGESGAPAQPPIKDQAERMERAAEEQQTQAAADRDAAEKAAAVDWRQFEENREQQQARYDRWTGHEIGGDPEQKRERERGGRGRGLSR